MIILDDVATGYGRKAVAEHIAAEIRSGELTCLIGPNGAGKSTLLRTLAGFLPALAGRVMLAGKPLSDYTPKELARLVSIVLTANSDIPNLSAGDVVTLGRSPYTGFWGTLGDDDRKIVDEALRLTATEHLRHRMINTLSDGERQKVMIAKALAQQTPVILLDEPTAFLDFPSKISMMRLLRNLAHDLGKTVFLSTHDLTIALQLADTIWLSDDSGNIVSDTPRSLVDSGILQKIMSDECITIDAESMTVRVEGFRG